jgi:hypothetical protein
VAAGQFERLRNANDFAHALQQLEIAMIEITMDAYRAQNGVRSTGGTMDVETAGDNAIDDMLNLLIGGVFLHHYDHGWASRGVGLVVKGARLRRRPLHWIL